MVTYEDIEQSDGSIKRNYSIIAGDTFYSSISITKNNEIINPEYIDTLKLKISDKNYNCVYCSNFTFNNDLQKYYIEVPANVVYEISKQQLEQSNKAKFIYEYELTLLDGYVTTIMQANLTITKQIGDCNNE